MGILRKQGRFMAVFEATIDEDKDAAHWANLVEHERELAGLEDMERLPYSDHIETLRFIIRHWGTTYELFPSGVKCIIDGIINNRFSVDVGSPVRMHKDLRETAEVLLRVVATSMTEQELMEHEVFERKIVEHTVFRYPQLQPERYEEIMNRLMKSALKQ